MNLPLDVERCYGYLQARRSYQQMNEECQDCQRRLQPASDRSIWMVVVVPTGEKCKHRIHEDENENSN